MNNDVNFNDLFSDINNLVPNDFNVDNILMNVDNMNDESIDFLCHENFNDYLQKYEKLIYVVCIEKV